MSHGEPKEDEMDQREERSYFGQSVERLEDDAILSGNSTYIEDVELPEMLHAKLLRSPVAHAIVESVDVSDALAMDGVVDAITGEDIKAATDRFGKRRSGLDTSDRLALSEERVRFMGDGVAAVAAESEYRAGDALGRIDVSYDRLEPVVDVDDALAGDEVIHPELQDDEAVDGNEWGEYSIDIGDVDEAFERADHVVSHSVTTNRPTAAPLEPHGAVANYDEADGTLTLYASTQEAHSIRSDLAAVLDMPQNKVRVVQPDNMGGGFGHKLALHDHEIVVAVLAMRTGRPVKVVLDRHEEFQGTWCRQPQEHDLELAVTDDGEFLGIRDRITSEAGAYTGIAKPGLVYACQMLATPYWIENVDIAGSCVFTNTVPASAYRGFGYTQATIARESLIDAAARELGFDRIALRRRNLIDNGDCPTTHPVGFYLDSCGTSDCLETAVEDIDTSLLDDPPAGHRRGFGTAAAMHVSSVQRPSYSSDNGAVTLRMEEDGTVTLLSDQCPMGTGTATSLAQIVGDELGLDYDDLAFEFGDTDKAPFGLGSWGSRAMVIAGSAAYLAAQSLKDRLLEIGSYQLDVPRSELAMTDGRIVVADDPERGVSLSEVAFDAHYNGERLPDEMTAGPLIVTEAFDNPAPGSLDDGRVDPAVNYPSGVHAVIVDVDCDTGDVSILDYAIADDIGEVINPMIVEGQLQGGAVQGIGMALGEHLEYNDSGQLLNGNMEAYRLPLINETPRITKISEADTTSERSPLGTKGVGESGLTVAPAAVMNAVNDAVDGPIASLPLDPETVHSAIADRGAD